MMKKTSKHVKLASTSERDRRDKEKHRRIPRSRADAFTRTVDAGPYLRRPYTPRRRRS